MSIFEYNKEEEERKIRKAEYEAGETRILNLIQRLALDGRSDEIPKLATDKIQAGYRSGAVHVISGQDHTLHTPDL